MNQEILFGDIQLAVVTRVRARLLALGSPAKVGTKIPNPRPALFVTVRRTGGPRTPYVVTEVAQVTVEAWGDNEKASSDLAEQVRAIVHAMAGGEHSGIPFYRVEEFSGPANLPDPESTQARYTQTLSMHVRATQITNVPA